jgi:hypothetical protein
MTLMTGWCVTNTARRSSQGDPRGMKDSGHCGGSASKQLPVFSEVGECVFIGDGGTMPRWPLIADDGDEHRGGVGDERGVVLIRSSLSVVSLLERVRKKKKLPMSNKINSRISWVTYSFLLKKKRTLLQSKCFHLNTKGDTPSKSATGKNASNHRSYCAGYRPPPPPRI